MSHNALHVPDCGWQCVCLGIKHIPWREAIGEYVSTPSCCWFRFSWWLPPAQKVATFRAYRFEFKPPLYVCKQANSAQGALCARGVHTGLLLAYMCQHTHNGDHSCAQKDTTMNSDCCINDAIFCPCSGSHLVSSKPQFMWAPPLQTDCRGTSPRWRVAPNLQTNRPQSYDVNGTRYAMVHAKSNWLCSSNIVFFIGVPDKATTMPLMRSVPRSTSSALRSSSARLAKQPCCCRTAIPERVYGFMNGMSATRVSLPFGHNLVDVHTAKSVSRGGATGHGPPRALALRPKGADTPRTQIH